MRQFKAGAFGLTFSLYLKINFGAKNYNLSSIDAHFLLALFVLLNEDTADNKEKRYAIELMHCAYQHCPIFAKAVRSALKGSTGIVRLALLYSIGKNRTKSFFAEFSSMLYFKKLPRETIKAFNEIDWSSDSDHTDHIIEILISEYTLAELSTFLEATLKSSKWYQPSIETFLALMVYIQKVFIHNDFSLELIQIGTFLSEHLTQESIFNFYRTTNTKLKQFFNYCVLNKFEQLEIGDFTKKEIDALIHDLSKVDYDSIDSNAYLLSNIATEDFVTERLLPLIKSSDGRSLLHKNLQIVINHAEHLLGQRYFV